MLKIIIFNKINMEQANKKNAWYGKIETKEDAIKVIKDSSNGFLLLSAIQMALGFIIGIETVIDGVIYLILALLLRKFNSRVVAIILLLLSLVSIVVTGMNKLGGGAGGRNVLLSLIVTWVSIRAIQATFVYNRLK